MARGAGLIATASVLGCSRAPAAFSCVQESGLSEAERAVRRSLMYVDTAQAPERSCERCVQYVPPPAAGCGRCNIMKGPAHPQGTCLGFSAKG